VEHTKAITTQILVFTPKVFCRGTWVFARYESGEVLTPSINFLVLQERPIYRLTVSLKTRQVMKRNQRYNNITLGIVHCWNKRTAYLIYPTVTATLQGGIAQGVLSTATISALLRVPIWVLIIPDSSTRPLWHQPADTWYRNRRNTARNWFEFCLHSIYFIFRGFFNIP
jgi:hypothetical protein